MAKTKTAQTPSATGANLAKELRAKYHKQALSIAELAREIGVSYGTIYGGIRTGASIPPYKAIGHGKKRQKIIFLIDDIATFYGNTTKIF